MAVLIKGMKMPICRTCPVCEPQLYGNCCRFTGEIVDFGILVGKKCPLVEVPPHGRLIDADALLTCDNPIGKMMMFGGEYVYTQTEISNAPTVIEAEEGEALAPLNDDDSIYDAPTIIEAEEGEA